MSSLLRSHAPHCSHHDGHVVASTVCGRHECSLANYGLLVNTTRDACGSGAFHGVVTATLIHTLIHRRLVTAGSLPDLRSRDPQLWAAEPRFVHALLRRGGAGVARSAARRVRPRPRPCLPPLCDGRPRLRRSPRAGRELGAASLARLGSVLARVAPRRRVQRRAVWPRADRGVARLLLRHGRVAHGAQPAPRPHRALPLVARRACAVRRRRAARRVLPLSDQPRGAPVSSGGAAPRRVDGAGDGPLLWRLRRFLRRR